MPNLVRAVDRLVGSSTIVDFDRAKEPEDTQAIILHCLCYFLTSLLHLTACLRRLPHCRPGLPLPSLGRAISRIFARAEVVTSTPRRTTPSQTSRQPCVSCCASCIVYCFHHLLVDSLVCKMPLPVPLSLEKLEAVAEQYGTPYQLYDEKQIRSNCRNLIASFSKHFPGFKQFYAVKALPNPAILRVLIDEGCGLDCSSISELHIARALGVPGHLCMYTSNYTSKKDLGIAFDYGVVINLDDISLVDALVEARGKCSELISFRLNPGLGRTDSETKSNVLGG